MFSAVEVPSLKLRSVARSLQPPTLSLFNKDAEKDSQTVVAFHQWDKTRYLRSPLTIWRRRHLSS